MHESLGTQSAKVHPGPILEVERLSKSYRQLSGETTVAIEEISCQVEAGEFVSFVGPSGCGKSTLLMSIAGLLAPTAGRIIVKGREVSGPPPNLVLVFQEFNKSLFAWRSVLGNVHFGLEARGKPSRAEKAKAEALIEMVGLKGFENHYPWELSGGMQQRVAIALALAYEPEVLLMDEPFGSLDALTRLELEDTLLKLSEELGTTILFITHDDEGMIVAVTVYASIWPILINTIDGVKHIDPVLVQTGRIFGLGPWRLLRCVILPAASPKIVTGLHIAWPWR